MDAIVLAGGYATRLWPITVDRPKMFLPVGETTVIDDVLTDLEADDRIETVYISTNERFADAFESHLQEADYDKTTLSIEDTSDEDEKFGVIGALAQLVEREGLTDDTIIVAGDNLISFGMSDFIDYFEDRHWLILAAYDVGTTDRATSYGVLDVGDDHEIRDFQKKPDDPPSTLVSVACYGFRASDLASLDTYLTGENNPDEPGWFVQWLVERDRVDAFTFDGAWFDIGTPESYLEAVAWNLEDESYVHPGATTDEATIGANAYVMDGAHIADATVRESVVFPDATVSGCTLTASIVDTGAEVHEMDVDSALIGPELTVNGSSVDH